MNVLLFPWSVGDLRLERFAACVLSDHLLVGLWLEQEELCEPLHEDGSQECPE